MAKKRVLVTVPNGSKWIHKETIEFLFNLTKDKRYNLTIQLPTFRPIANNQHHIINEFIEGKYDYWFSLDDDIVPLQNPLDLIELDKDIIGIPIPIWRFTRDLKFYDDRRIPVYLGVYDYDEKEDAFTIRPTGKGLERVGGVAGGCFIMARRVFDNKLLRTRGWWRRLKKDGTIYMGNDMSFCYKALKEGFEIWAHYDYTAKHFKNIDLGGIMTIYGK
jgi:hypothetical protein